MSTQDVRYSFIVDWYDAQASLIRQYQFLFYPKDNSVEMYDVKNKKKFFSRSRIDSLSIKQLFLGNRINVCSRQLDIVEYGDDYTRKMLSQAQERTLALIKPDALANSGEIIEMMESSTKLRICDCRMVQMARSDAEKFYAEHQGKPFYDGLVTHMSSAPVLCMELIGDNAVSAWRDLIGPTNPVDAKTTAPNSIRARFGSVLPKNACHGSDSQQSAMREIDFFFGAGQKNLNTTAQLGSSGATCVVVKPHCVLNGQFGSVLAQIQKNGWNVIAAKLHNFERANAEEFYEVYKEVVQEYDMMVSELTSGPCVALEVVPMDTTEDSVMRFKKEVAGPRDPVIAKELDKQTLRALFGQDKVKNCVHCTDLPRDSILELSYCFQILCE